MIRASGAGRRRPLALFLTLVFLAAGTTLPGLDALLHHGGESARAAHHPHVEPAGGCASHADACTLGRTATGAGATLADAPVVRAEPIIGGLLPAPTRASAPRYLLDLLPSPRAPPAPVA